MLQSNIVMSVLTLRKRNTPRLTCNLTIAIVWIGFTSETKLKIYYILAKDNWIDINHSHDGDAWGLHTGGRYDSD
jgi:hypothetical protein